MSQLVIKLPDVGEGTAQAELAAWHVAVGDMVNEDQNLADVTTDKATVEIPSPAAGKVVSLRGAPGDVIAVGSPLIVLETEGTLESKPVKVNGHNEAVPIAPPSAAEPRDVNHNSKQLASPAVRERVKALNIDLARVVGTGPVGRVLHKDLDTYLLYERQFGQSPSTSPSSRVEKQEDIKEVKIIGIRRKIAERMQESKRHIPHFAYVEEVDVTALEDLRTELNTTYGESRGKLSVLPLVLAALVKVLPEFPQVNAHFDDETGVLRQYRPIHVGVATQTSRGLMVPVVFNAEGRDLWNLAAEVNRAAQSARDGTADRKALGGSTITVTSLGRLGGIVTTPVINRPEVAIIGINKITERPMVRLSQIAVRRMMNLSSSFDHRIIDGGDAAALIQRLKTLLEQPAMLFIK